MGQRIRRFREWLALTHLLQGVSEAEARAIRMTRNLQIVFFVLPTLLIPNVYFVEAQETHLYAFCQYILLVALIVISRLLSTAKRPIASAVVMLFNVNSHIAGICVANADDPAYLGFLITAFLPFLMFPSRHRILRWVHVLIPAVLFLVYQYYYRVFGGAGIFGPPKWLGDADYFMPPLVLLCFFLILIVYQFVKAVDQAEARLLEEYERSENLLLNILPQEVADELKLQGVSKPRHFESTTVCFTDFKGFTNIAEQLTPEELVEELGRCFSYFDSLMDRHNLEKLKTIGDSYMFAGGIPTPNQTHAVDCVLAALEIQVFMSQVKEEKSRQGAAYWELRLGVHSGDLVAGVIGDKKFAYDVWSDTVNTASKCESSGVVGKVNISRATYELVKEFFQCEYRGRVPAKNKGEIDMYFVHGLLLELRQDPLANAPNAEFAKRYAALQQPTQPVSPEARP